ncbi:MAG: hypothetical protein KJ958_05545 [Gammaproteobacteria bacterium]|nr:hypothetical protein [Gammaproteobacteria bacterium]MBU1978618.1 hypothetical protein [Gammaproteobacteria bacterium]
MKILRPMSINNPALVSSNVPEADYAAYNPITPYALGTKVIDVSPAATVTLSIASPCVVNWPAHGLPLMKNSKPVATPVVLATTGALPPELTVGVAYYVLPLDTDHFMLSTTHNGAPINTSGTQSGTHTVTASIHKCYESLQAANTGHTPRSNPTWWLDLGNTNSWKMFDQSVTSQTSNPDSIAVVIKALGRMDSVALLNINASTVRFVMTDAVDGVVYDHTYSMVSTSGITDSYAYCFEAITRITDYVELDMPPYANAQITVTLTDTGGTVLCGTCVIGQRKELGGTQYGASVGIMDYSLKQRDAFGNYDILEREFSKRGKFLLWVDNSLVDELQIILASFRATPIVYIGADTFGCSVIYGFYKDFSTVIQYANNSICDIELEGLT